MEFDSSFFQEEERSGFLVTEKRKKVWATGLRMLEQFDAVCKKYDLKYYVYYGTLLGAVRHQGFIPWDDDIDVVMLREDYDRFRAVAPGEFQEPYFFQDSYTDRLIWPFSKIRDSRTTAIEPKFAKVEGFHQGIFMDIFPLDSVADGKNAQFQVIEEIQRLLWDIVMDPRPVLMDLSAGKEMILDPGFIVDLVKTDIKYRFQVFEEFMASHFGETERVNYILHEMYPTHYRSAEREWFRETVYLPFEHLQVPAPAEYDKILTQSYGDYRQPVRGGTEHEDIILEPEIPYTEYLKKLASYKHPVI